MWAGDKLEGGGISGNGAYHIEGSVAKGRKKM